MAIYILVITGYKWDYTFYKWGFVSTYNIFNIGLLKAMSSGYPGGHFALRLTV